MKSSLLACVLVSCARVTVGQAAAPRAGAESAKSVPALFGAGVLSTVDHEGNATFAPDGRTIYFTKFSPDQSFGVIVSARRRRGGGGWSEPEVAPFSGRFSDSHPFVSPDGSRLYFSSARARGQTGAKQDYDVWVSERGAVGWGAPRPLGAGVNTAANEMSPAVTADGTLYFWSDRPGGEGGYDIYRSRPVGGGREHGPAENLGGAINSGSNEGDLFVAPDGAYLLFASDRPGGAGRLDLYVSRALEGAWGAPENLGPWVNSAAQETSPCVTPDGRHLLFVSTRGYPDTPPRSRVSYRELKTMLESVLNGYGNFYRADAGALGRRP